MSNAMPTTTETTSTMIRISHTVWLEPEVGDWSKWSDPAAKGSAIRKRTPFTIQLAVDTKTPELTASVAS